MNETVKGFKGFNKGLKCRDFQFEVGQKHTLSGEVAICSSGFHFCENPLDIFNYYPPTSEFCEVEGSGDIKRQVDGSGTWVQSGDRIKRSPSMPEL